MIRCQAHLSPLADGMCNCGRFGDGDVVGVAEGELGEPFLGYEGEGGGDGAVWVDGFDVAGDGVDEPVGVGVDGDGGFFGGVGEAEWVVGVEVEGGGVGFGWGGGDGDVVDHVGAEDAVVIDVVIVGVEVGLAVGGEDSGW